MTIRGMMIAVMAMLSAAPALAQGGGLTIDEAADVLRGEGLSIDIQREGDPSIYGALAGTPFDLYAYNCEGEPARCDEFLFSSRFETTAPVSADSVNAFNQMMIAGRALIDSDGAAVIEHFFTVTRANGAALVSQNLAIFESVLADFEEYLALLAEPIS